MLDFGAHMREGASSLFCLAALPVHGPTQLMVKHVRKWQNGEDRISGFRSSLRRGKAEIVVRDAKQLSEK
jgi:hypothetical protein